MKCIIQIVDLRRIVKVGKFGDLYGHRRMTLYRNVRDVYHRMTLYINVRDVYRRMTLYRNVRDV